jgi:hypothetical protein
VPDVLKTNLIPISDYMENSSEDRLTEKGREGGREKEKKKKRRRRRREEREERRGERE